MFVVIEVLPATRGIFTHCLHSSAGIRVDAHIRPRRRDFQLTDSREVITSRFLSVSALIAKTLFRRSGPGNALRAKSFDSGHKSKPLVLQGWIVAMDALEFFVQFFQLRIRKLFEIYQPVARALDAPDELIQFEMDGLVVAVLRVLN